MVQIYSRTRKLPLVVAGRYDRAAIMRAVFEAERGLNRAFAEAVEHRQAIEERHATRPEAVAAARRLLAEHAHRFDLRVSHSAEVFSELEWVAIANRGETEDDEEA